ncbi:lytic transglycosylase domain-containing protein [Streptomyces sp. NPDC046887]|uniref:lytic transglycosylase domain-containing protein n=1 Tax=Streptomyces sp. NPDC046887 TaxID=3155472 RepID=UPI0034060294
MRRAALAAAAVTVLTASQAPVQEGAQGGGDQATALAAPGGNGTPGIAAPGGLPVPGPLLPGQTDGSYHTELPPLAAVTGPLTPPAAALVRAESGIPATVLAAYRAAEESVRRGDPGCRLPWQLLAAIGKVESGHARGGAVAADGTTRGRILGPVLNGNGFAVIADTDHGAYDGHPQYDRAVGPMQFIPSTWARWGADGSGDGRADPDNVFDAALAAGRYLCAGDRDLALPAGLDRAVLSYNHSTAYLRTVRYWLAFYRTGAHGVPDGSGTLPHSPGAGGTTPATRPTDPDIIIGPPPGPRPAPSPTPTPAPSPRPTTSPRPTPSPTPRPTGSPTTPGTPTPTPSSPSPTPTPTPSPTDSTTPSPDPGTPTATPPSTPLPTSTLSPSPTPSPTADATPSSDPSGTP